MAKKKYGTQSKGDADPNYEEARSSSGDYIKRLKKKKKKKKGSDWNKQYGDNISGQGVSGASEGNQGN